MNKRRAAIEKMWTNYLNSIGENLKNTHKAFDAWHFGSDEDLANSLAKLVLEGKKTSTTSLYCLYRLENSNLPGIGEHSIILDFKNNPQCVIKIVKVEVLPFNKVSEEFAISEGEDDLTLRYWRHAHQRLFESELFHFKKEFREDMKVVCETFEVVYKNKN
ncbi:MAG: ASCH domain-containing protein [Spirochaetaceae bacterium]|nr:ASCH domain-containing protein [Spirochaetaceae bacterium]